MKKLLFFLITFLVIVLPQALHAQLNQGRSGVAVFVSSVQSLVVRPRTNAEGGNISKNINDTSNIQIGQISEVSVLSFGKFVLKVSARDDFHDVDGPEIPPNAVYVSSGAVAGSGYDPIDYKFETDVNLGVNDPKDLIHAQSAGALNNTFEIEYYASGLNYDDLHSGNLDGTVVYTIEVE